VTRFAIDPQALIDLVRDGRPVAPAHQLVSPKAVRWQALELLLQAVDREQLSEGEELARLATGLVTLAPPTALFS
jgi:hypothetical protein